MNAPFQMAGDPYPSPAPNDPVGAALATRRFLTRTQARARSLLRAAGLDLAAYTIVVRATVDADGVVTEVRVARSSGAPGVDDLVETVLRNILRSSPIMGLMAGVITLRLGPTPQVLGRAA
ncbi:MAG TPA: TonB family protein [Phenylobacterium sp.]|jgi:TonB family protein